MATLPSYHSFEEKHEMFKTYSIIRTKQELDTCIERLKALKDKRKESYLFRGVNDARYKLYTSSQRLWIQRDLSKNNIDYHHRILSMLDFCKRDNSILSNYLKRLGITTNDWLYLSFLQHYGAASPLLDFSKEFQTALFFACDNINLYTNDELGDYVSIYYYKKVDVAHYITPSIISLARKHAQNRSKFQPQDFWSSLSYDKIMSEKSSIIVSAYSHESKVKNNNGDVITIYTVANLNSTAQDGEFVCNATPDIPLEELWNINGVKYIHCVDIHKSLIEYIIKHYLGGNIEISKKRYYPSERDIADDAQWMMLSNI